MDSPMKQIRVGLPVMFEGYQNADMREIITFWDDFIGSSVSGTDNANRWYVAGTGTAVPADGTDASQEMAGGLLVVTVEATASDCVSCLAPGEAFQLDQGYPIYFECRYMNVDVSALQTFVGLAASDASAIAGLVNGIGFEGVGTTLSTVVDNAGNTENVDAVSGLTLTDLAWMVVAFYYDGVDTVTFWYSVNGAAPVQANKLTLSTTTDYVPQDLMLTPAIEAENAAADGSADLLYVDYMLVMQPRCWAAE